MPYSTGPPKLPRRRPPSSSAGASGSGSTWYVLRISAESSAETKSNAPSFVGNTTTSPTPTGVAHMEDDSRLVTRFSPVSASSPYSTPVPFRIHASPPWAIGVPKLLVARSAPQTFETSNPSPAGLISKSALLAAASSSGISPRPRLAPMRNCPSPTGTGVGVVFPLRPSARHSCLPVSGSRPTTLPVPDSTR